MMSPLVRPPPIPRWRGRPRPGNQLRRPGTPTARELTASPANFAAVAGGNAPRAFDFTFESEVTPGTIAPLTTPAPSDDGADVANYLPPLRPVAAHRPPAANTSAPPARPIPAAGGFYGQAFVAGRGRLLFAPSPRMEEWLEGLQALSLERQEDMVSAAAPMDGAQEDKAASDGSENVRAGNKRKSPSNDDDDNEARDKAQPAVKRSRVSDIMQRAFSRMGQNRADSTASKPVPAASASVSAIAPSTIPRPFSPFSLRSRIGFGTAPTASAGAPSSLAATRTIKVCLVGDVAAGKTALFNRLVNDSFVPPSPSLAPDFKVITLRAEDNSVVNVELWDFPGIVAGERSGPLLSTFFHAAIICFSLEDKKHLASLSEVWKPKLDASLHDQHVFVLGLKRDLRPSFPTLGLSFLPTTEPVTSEMGCRAAEAIQAKGYGECSARTNDNLQAAWKAIIDYVVAGLDDHERTIHSGGRRGRVKTAVAGFLNGCGMGRFGKDEDDK